MRRRLVVLSFVLGQACSSDISGGDIEPWPDAGGGAQGPVAEHCSNGVDDDHDLAVDCWDTDCSSFARCGGGLPEVGVDAGPVDDPFGVDAGPVPDPEPAELDGGEGGEEVVVVDVTAGQSVDASIDPAGDDDWYRIRLVEGDRLIVETSDGAGSCEVDTIVQLFGATLPDPLPVSTSCEDETDEVTCDDDGGEGACSLVDDTATADGLVHVRVLAYGGTDTGDYHVSFTVLPAADVDVEGDDEDGGEGEGEPESDDSPGEARAIADGDVVEGAIDPAGDADYFTFEVHAFDTVRLETSDGEGGCNFDSVVTLYDDWLEEPAEGTSCLDDFDAFDCDDDYGIEDCSLLEHFFWLDWTILARVTSFGHLSTGAYTLSVSIE